MRDQRVRELEELAREEGFTLPLPAATIIRMEDAGNTVDLRTGAVEISGANARYAPTSQAGNAWNSQA